MRWRVGTFAGKQLFSCCHPMALKLKPSNVPSSSSPSPFSWDNLPTSPSLSPSAAESLPSPPTSWLSAKDMKVFGAEPLRTEIGIVRCKDCDKAVLKSAVTEHAGFHHSFARSTMPAQHYYQTTAGSFGPVASRKASRASQALISTGVKYTRLFDDPTMYLRDSARQTHRKRARNARQTMKS